MSMRRVVVGIILLIVGIVVLRMCLTNEAPSAPTVTPTAVAIADTPRPTGTSMPTMTPTATRGRGTRRGPTRTPRSALADSATPAPPLTRERGAGAELEATDTSAASAPTAAVESTATQVSAPGSPTQAPDSTGTPTAAATSTSPPTIEAEPTGENLLLNPGFSARFSNWNMTNGHWLVHDISGSECAQNNPNWPVYMAEMDIDNCQGCNTWQVGDEDWLWQDVTVPSHSRVIFTITEAHHMRSGNAEVRIYGSTNGQNWQLIWQRAEVQAEFGAGHQCETPPTFSYEIDASYAHYRLEFYGRINEEGDGWIFGPVALRVD